MEFDLLGLLDGNVRSASSAQASLRERINSVIPAVVSDTKDTEKLGRVKVRFAFTGRVESRWARVAVPFAGSLRGTYFVPEVDDEVLVAFRNGDLDQPYVIGFLWSAKARPPEAEASQRRSVI